MDVVQGSLILEKVPDKETENKIITFLSQYTKTLSPEKIQQILRKAPVILIKKISESEGKILEKRLKELGGAASFQIPQDEQETETEEYENYPPVPAFLKTWDSPDSGHASDSKKQVIRESTFTYIIQKFAEVNKELWIILSMLAIVLAMNYLFNGQRMLLGLYTIPTIISAYAFGRQHATLTALASILLVGLFTHFKPELFTRGISTNLFIDEQWFDIVAWGGILVLTAYAMGTLYERNQKRFLELSDTYQGLSEILQQFISNDQYTENHCHRTSIYAAKIASYMNLSPEKIEDVRSAALLHNLGKPEICRNVLHKAALLTDEGYQNIKHHVEKGTHTQIPADRPLKRIIPLILAHQENYEGSGYYASLGKRIPIESRILGVADTYDSLVSDSPYRKAMTPYEAKEIIENGAGTDFDPKVVQAFLQAFTREELEVPGTVV